ncbi:surface-anchored protein [Trueperella bonasi]|uniref:Surface-anchored protein n=1 Tax=Trueperella bonasi TaxID=312286 RepID=A0ABT9NFQ7_9ACTO|nr:choice-of-anchor M domain-containing protein [Trueperella bonasi]MDP9806228.1 surface-anchored protein [Trueperella bonasi]
MKMRRCALGFAVALAGIPVLSQAAVADTEETEGPSAVDPALTQVVDAEEEVAPRGTEVVLDAGHIDMGPKFIDDQWTLMIRDDTDIEPVWRHLEDVVFQVNDGGIMELPDDPAYDFIGADGEVWVIPQTEIPDVVWLGWNTQDPEVTHRVQGTVSFVFGGHQGDGSFNVFVQAGNFGGPQELWTSAKDESQPISVELNNHTHANWIFTEPGVHLVRMSASATLDDGSSVQDTQLLRFAVGNETNPDDARPAAIGGEAGDDAGDNGEEETREAQGEEWTQEAEPEEPADIDEPSAVDENENVPAYVAIGLGALLLVAVVIALVVRNRNKQKREAAKAAVEAEAADRE